MTYTSKRHTEPFDGKRVTPQQHKFLMAIEAHWRGHQGAPTHRELAKAVGVSLTRSHQYSTVLRNRGLVRITPKTMRSLRTSRMKTGYGQYKGEPGFIVMWEGEKNVQK